MSETLECVVIGGGVIGLAIGSRLALSGREVLLLESESALGTHTSSRNSEVIHAGIYYPRGSLKGTLCVRGNKQLYEFVTRRRIAHRNCGKIIVAVNNDELPILDKYRSAAEGNGVMDLRYLSSEEVFELEPSVRCSGALLSPSTGIIDSHGLMDAFEADIENAGSAVVCRTRVAAAAVHKDGFTIDTVSDGLETEIRCKLLINAAGLQAPAVARSIRGLNPEFVPAQHLAIGHYYSLQGRAPFQRLVYPVASGGGLGVHVTPDLAGQVRFGPDVSWIDSVDYAFDESRKPDFVEAIRRYYPDLDSDKLVPGYTGIRPKLSGPGEEARDFVISGPKEHSIHGLVNLFGIESPGLTSSLAIADVVAGKLGIE